MGGILALGIGYIFSHFYRSFIAVLTPVLTTDLGATNADFSLASGIWFMCFALAQFGVGVWLDRYGPRWTASLLLAVAAVGAILFSLATQPWMLVVAMGLIGIGCSAVLMGALFIFARTYSPARMAVLTSWMVALGSAGNVIGTSPLAAAAEAYGWRPVVGALGAATFLTAAAIALLVRDPVSRESATAPGLRGYMELFRLRQLWPIVPLMAFCYAAAAGIRGLWVGPYLSDVYAANPLTIGRVSLAMALAMVAGAFLYGPLDTLFRTRKWVCVGGNGLCVLVLAALALYPAPGLAATTVMLMLIGLTGASYGLLMAHASAFFPAHLVGRGVTLMNFYAMVGVGLMQLVTGAAVAVSFESGEASHAYSALFGLYALVLALSVLAYLGARDVPPGERAPSATLVDRE